MYCFILVSIYFFLVLSALYFMYCFIYV
jgi:hypothetical protein